VTRTIPLRTVLGTLSLLLALVTGCTTRESLTETHGEANGDSGFPAVADNGAFLAFQSDAADVVPGDTNGTTDVFVRDRRGTPAFSTRRVSVASDGTQADGPSRRPSISDDGARVAFVSEATNLAPGDTNGAADVFVHDLLTGTTTRVSVATDGTQADGRTRDAVAISADGSRVAFVSEATNLAPGDTNDAADVFVHNLLTGTTTRVSVATDGTQADGPTRDAVAISADGSRVAFVSEATNLAPGDTNGAADVFVHDLLTGTTTRVSVATDGTQADGEAYPEVALSRDGTTVAFTSDATNLVPGLEGEVTRVFVRRLDTGTTEVVSVPDGGGSADGDCGEPAVSETGRYVAFVCEATNLVPGDTNDVPDVFRRDRQTGRTERVSLGADDAEANGPAGEPALSRNGLLVAFASLADNLLGAQSGDANGTWDVFARLQLAPSP